MSDLDQILLKYNDMYQYYLGIGSNDSSEKNIKKIIEAIKAHFQSILISSIIKTKALDNQSLPYLNAVILLESDLDKVALKHWCRKIENKLGRERFTKRTCRADIDILDLNMHNECYIKKLIEQINKFNNHKKIFFFKEAVEITLDNGEKIGFNPVYLSAG